MGLVSACIPGLRMTGSHDRIPGTGKPGQRRASRIRLNGVSAARRKCVKPALRKTSASRACPACAPSTSWPPSEIAWAQQIVVERRSTAARPGTGCPRRGRAQTARPAAPCRCGASTLRGVARRGHRVAQVVQRVEEADQAVAAVRVAPPRVPPRSCTRSATPAVAALRRASSSDAGMRVEAEEARVRKGLGHQQRRVAVAAADVGHVDAGLELLDHAVQRRQPLRHQARAVAVAIERGHATGQPRIVLAPGHAAAGAEGLERLVLVEPHRRRHVPRRAACRPGCPRRPAPAPVRATARRCR